MPSGFARSLTDAGPRLSRSTSLRRVGSPSASKTWSNVVWLSMHFSIPSPHLIVKSPLKCRLIACDGASIDILTMGCWIDPLHPHRRHAMLHASWPSRSEYRRGDHATADVYERSARRYGRSDGRQEVRDPGRAQRRHVPVQRSWRSHRLQGSGAATVAYPTALGEPQRHAEDQANPAR